MTLLTEFRTDFTSSVWNFQRLVADVIPRETSSAAKSEEKRLFSQTRVQQTQFFEISSHVSRPCFGLSRNPPQRKTFLGRERRTKPQGCFDERLPSRGRSTEKNKVAVYISIHHANLVFLVCDRPG